MSGLTQDQMTTRFEELVAEATPEFQRKITKILKESDRTQAVGAVGILSAQVYSKILIQIIAENNAALETR